MPVPRPERGRISWVAAAALAALAAGLALATSHWWPRRPPADAPAPATAGVGDTSGDVVGRALELAGDLDPARREVAIRFANARRCTCGCGFTLAACRTYDPTCETSLPLVEKLVDSVRAGLLRNTHGLRPRPAPVAPSGG